MKYIKENELHAANMLKAMSHPTRSWIVKELSRDSHNVGEFVNAVGVEFATMSRHLAKLRTAGIITSKKKGREIYYSLNRAALTALFSELTGS